MLNQSEPVGRQLGKAAADRLNMGRCFVFSLFSCAVILFLTACFSVLNFYIIPKNIQTILFLIFAALLFLYFIVIYIVAHKHIKHMYSRLYTSMLFVLMAALFTFAVLAEKTAVSIVFYWTLMMILGLLPVMRFKNFMIIWFLQLFPLSFLIINKSFTAEGIISIITINIMSIVLSVITYGNTVKKLNFRVSLNSALSQAETDPMTLLLNRRGFDKRIENLWGHYVRENIPIAVIMIDIDFFKKYNDTFGHTAGDECIRKVTGVIRSQLKRRTDYAARVGGEEFLILLSDIDVKEAINWSLDLKSRIDELRIPHSTSNFRPYVSVSMGLCCSFVQSDTVFDQLREEADRSLYDAKQNGRACLYYKHKAYGRVSVLHHLNQA